MPGTDGLGIVEALRLWGESGILIATALLTVVLLIFSEVTPKTIAALHPEKIAYPSTIVLTWLLKLLHPLVWLVSAMSNGLVCLLRQNVRAGLVRLRKEVPADDR